MGMNKRFVSKENLIEKYSKTLDSFAKQIIKKEEEQNDRNCA